MKKKAFKLLPVVLIASFGLAFSGCDDVEEQEIAETEIPAAIVKAFSLAYPDAIIRAYSEDSEDGKTVYEISAKLAGEKINIVYSQDGDVIELEETIPETALPAAIWPELDRNFENYKIAELERVTKAGKSFFELEVNTYSDGKRKKYKVFFSKDGKLTSKEREY